LTDDVIPDDIYSLTRRKHKDILTVATIEVIVANFAVDYVVAVATEDGIIAAVSVQGVTIFAT
jgi:hypothetical protein